MNDFAAQMSTIDWDCPPVILDHKLPCAFVWVFPIKCCHAEQRSLPANQYAPSYTPAGPRCTLHASQIVHGELVQLIQLMRPGEQNACQGLALIQTGEGGERIIFEAKRQKS